MQEHGISIRRRREADLPAIAAIRNMARVRWGTLSMPWTSVHHTRQRLQGFGDDVVSLVAWRGGQVVGEASIHRRPQPRVAHSASLGIMVADDAQGGKVGSALMAALLALADDWLGLRRLELGVYADNAPAIALYRKFGFEVEGLEVADAYRAGAFADSYVMARLRGGLPADGAPWPEAAPGPGAAAAFRLRAAEPEDLQAVAALMAQASVRHGTLRMPFEAPEQAQGLVAPADPAVKCVVAEAAGKLAGIGVLKPAAMRRAHCGCVELLAVDEAWRRCGVGGALLAALLEVADDWLNLKRLHLAVTADNAPALALFRRAGFAAETLRRAAVFRAGGFVDVTGMARLR